MNGRYIDRSEESRTSSALIRLTHWYSGAAWLWLVTASFHSLVWLEAHVQLAVTLLYLATLGFSLLAESSARWYMAWSYFMLWTDISFAIFQMIAVSIHYDRAQNFFVYAFPIAVLIGASVFKIVLDVLVIKTQHSLLKVPLQTRLLFSKHVLDRLSHELRRFLLLNVLYAALLSADLVLSRVVLELEEPRTVADLMLVLQVLMPSLMANLVFKVQKTARASLSLFLLSSMVDAGRFWYILARAADPFGWQGILRIVFVWLRISVLVVLGIHLWRQRKPLVLTMRETFH
jgi:hypothetical protein